jgi:hypothetical protein
VVRHLQDVRVQRHPRGEQLRLGGDLDVPAEQHRSGGRRRPDDDRAVVHLRAVVRIDVFGGMLWREHLQRQPGPDQPDAGVDLDDLRARRRGLPAHPLQRPHRLVDRTDGHRPHRPAPQRTGETAHVVGVQVADHDHRDGVNAQPVQACVDRPVVGARVDEHRTPRLTRREDQRVALADVARHDHPARRRPPGPDDSGRDQHEQQADDGSEQQRPDAPRPGEDDECQHDRTEQRGTTPPPGPRDDRARDRRRPIGHRHQPPDRRPGQPGTQLRPAR